MKLKGDVFYDGSCSKPGCPELAWASWALAQIGRQGQLQYLRSGVVPASLSHWWTNYALVWRWTAAWSCGVRKSRRVESSDQHDALP